MRMSVEACSELRSPSFTFNNLSFRRYFSWKRRIRKVTGCARLFSGGLKNELLNTLFVKGGRQVVCCNSPDNQQQSVLWHATAWRLVADYLDCAMAIHHTWGCSASALLWENDIPHPIENLLEDTDYAFISQGPWTISCLSCTLGFDDVLLACTENDMGAVWKTSAENSSVVILLRWSKEQTFI